MIPVLERCLPEDHAGDLAETYAANVRVMGEWEARRRHRRHVLTCLMSLVWRWLGDMMRNEVPTVAAALSIGLTGYGCLVRATAETWWVKSGFDRNPGYFVSENGVDYPVCDAFAGQGRGSHAVLVPKSARITKVYCNFPGQQIRLSDDNYTRGRVLTAPVSFRVVWEN